MKDNNAPATKADIQVLLKEFANVNGRIDGLDERIGGLDRNMNRFEKRIDGLDDRVCQVDHHLAGLDGRVDGFGERLKSLDQKLDAFRKETVEKLDEIHRECGILIENTHTDVAGASADSDQILREKNDALERRVIRLEEAVGLTAA